MVKSALSQSHQIPDFSNTIAIGGQFKGTRVTRCTDKFVRYPYPKCVNSYYQKEHRDYLKNTIVLRKGEAFNLEKETKIINPHRVETTTQSKNTYKHHKVEPKRRILRSTVIDYKPAID